MCDVLLSSTWKVAMTAPKLLLLVNYRRFIPIAEVCHEVIYYLQWFTINMNGNFEDMYVVVLS